MKIDRFNPRDKSETKDLCKYYCMPTDKNGFIIWKGPRIPLDMKEYISMLIMPKFKANTGKTLTFDDVLTICQLRYMAARSSLRNAEENSDKMGNYNNDFDNLLHIMRDCDSLYEATKRAKVQRQKAQNQSLLSNFLIYNVQKK
jgi:hypothetical protein